MDRLQELTRFQFHVARTIHFPTSSLRYDNAMQSIVALNNAVSELANDYQARFVLPNSDWYGLDPIHIRRRNQRVAWKKILVEHSEQSCSDVRRLRRLATRVCCTCPRSRHLFGRLQQRLQPALMLANGTSIAIY